MAGIVDVHHHIMEKQFLSIQEPRIKRTGYWGEKLTEWTPDWSIDEMDKNGAATSILSISAPGSWTGKVEESRKLARILNEYKAQVVRDHPGRFGFFATIPLPDIDGSLAELAYALDVLKADGICVLTNYDGKYPGDAGFAPVYDELNRRKAIVYSHPAAVDCCVNLQPALPHGDPRVHVRQRARNRQSAVRAHLHPLPRYPLHFLALRRRAAHDRGPPRRFRFRPARQGLAERRAARAETAQFRYREHE